MATFSPEEKSRIRFHAGVPDTDKYPDAMFGSRGAVFDIEAWMTNLNDTGRPRVLEVVAHMDTLLQRQAEVSDIAEVDKLGAITVSGEAFQRLEQQYQAWRQKLLGALNPAHARASAHGQAGGINGSWR